MCMSVCFFGSSASSSLCLPFSAFLFRFFFFNDTATTEIYTLSYTTLFRSTPHPRPDRPVCPRPPRHLRRRSEEHTSELQSLRHLVCRLLLEKKKKNKITIIEKRTKSRRDSNEYN